MLRLPKTITIRNTVTGVTLLVLLLFAVYWPGLHGPFLFDDHSNILSNPWLQITEHSFQTLKKAAFSISSGPLQRPIAALSFALNYSLTDGYSEFVFKTTNLVIHGLSTLALFWLCSQIMITPAVRSEHSLERRLLLSFAVAAAWAFHPIQLTSVLYVVQRMTALAGLFSFLTLGCYLRGRQALSDGNSTAVWLFWGAIAPLTFVLGLYSKENTAVVLLLIPLLDWVLYPKHQPWSYWHAFSKRQQWLAILAICALSVIVAAGLANHFGSRYGSRAFDLPERLMTEGRVIWFYISLIIFPQLTRFGLYHDDIAISLGLFDPITTLPAIIGLLVVTITALWLRRRTPLIALGILWYLCGHLLESTIIPLEIAHEHRNYLPSAGLLLALISSFAWIADSLKKNSHWLFISLFIITLAALTAVRASQWGTYQQFVVLSSLHHPDSARTQNELATFLYRAGEYSAATESAIQAATLAPEEPAYIFNARLAAGRAELQLPPGMLPRAVVLLNEPSHSAMTQRSLKRFSTCVFEGGCEVLLENLGPWLSAAINGTNSEGLKNRYRHFLGRVQIASGDTLAGINTLQQLHNSQPYLEQPLFDLASLFFQIGQLDALEKTIRQIEKSDREHAPSRDSALEQLKQAALELRENNGATAEISPGPTVRAIPEGQSTHSQNGKLQ